ncbi:hypothetical protein DW352_02765 [Pseudolabrys taiwanensis]|uniref:Uncharacterized protein n=1 Tax=Pseudolabrys taiwanensis TaxID=331696 RepID=A0A345ZRI7_9HYPH|nr:hypothetical protein [Pseudolabrys taiwanensis]AXK79534.1 hypothetical protein DW352_02765 [Pseudolabrys taiwanensis]
MFDTDVLREEHERCYAQRTRNTVVTALACVTIGALLTYLTALALPLMGLLVGLATLGLTLIISMIVYALSEPPGETFEEFAEIMYGHEARTFDMHR